jgi:short-subunit dehydrogenase
VLTSSLAGLSGGPKLASYAGTKAYLLAFGRSLRRELRPSGVSVLTVVPGAVNTPGYGDREHEAPANGRRWVDLMEILRSPARSDVRFRRRSQGSEPRGGDR